MQGFPGQRPPPKQGLSAGVIALLVAGGFVVLGAVGLVLLIVVYASVHGPPRGSVDAGSGAAVVEAPVASAPASAPPLAPPSPAKPAPKGPRTVDFRCPAGTVPGGTVRAGCLCGDLILGTACGKGGFRDVTATATGCRFVCD